jgi:hypothetical protein
MARIRTIKPDFFTSESVSALPYSARLTFIGLWTYADDEFRCVDNPKLIRAAIWPLDDRTLGDIEKDIDELAASGMVVRYRVGDRNYLHIPGMGTHQRVNRPTGSKLPPPPTSGDAVKTHTQLSENSRGTHVTLTEDSPPEGKGRELGREQGTGNGVTPPVVELSALPLGKIADNIAEEDKPYHLRNPLTVIQCPEHQNHKIGDCPTCGRERGNRRWYADPKNWRESDRKFDERDFARLSAWVART